MAIDFQRDASTLIIQAAERVDSTNAQRFLEDLDAAIEPTDQVVVLDMENLTYISSAGLRVILQTAKTLQRQNSSFALCTLSGTVREVFEISGFDQVISIHDSQAEALSALKS
jgi:anti-anti-sigma factor